MKVFKFEKFPRKVSYNGEVYSHNIGGPKKILVEVAVKGKTPYQYIFQNEIH
jgi:hypothetical protein